MEHNRKILSPEEWVAQLPELLEVTQQVPLTVSGSSMVPFLVHGRDVVYLSKISCPLKRGDIILYQRKSGRCVLHRICRVEQDSYCLVGDAQGEIEKGIRREQVLALVTAVRRKGKLLKKGNFCWFFFEKIWLAMIPARRWTMKRYARLRKAGIHEHH